MSLRQGLSMTAVAAKRGTQIHTQTYRKILLNVCYGQVMFQRWRKNVRLRSTIFARTRLACSPQPVWVSAASGVQQAHEPASFSALGKSSGLAGTTWGVRIK
jgi:hypothetical protein